MGKKGKKAQAGKPKKLTPKDVGKRLDALAKKVEEELNGADLFAPLPPTEDCAICFVPLSHLNSEACYSACCGKVICWACFKENNESIKKQNKKNAGDKKAIASFCPFCREHASFCPFCREPDPTSNLESLRQLQARCLQNDHVAFTAMGDRYQNGKNGTPKNGLKALDCFIRAIELGSPEACNCIGEIYHEGNGVAVDKERAALFIRVGALRGSIVARHGIGFSEYHDLDNHEIGIRHFKIAAEAGFQLSLDALRSIYSSDGNELLPGNEFITKECLDFAYRACHEAQMQVKSEEREKYRSKVQANKST